MTSRTHTHTRIQRFLASAGVAVMSLPLVLTADQAAGQTPRFRLTPLVKLNFTPNADFNGTIGINNKGQVVYGYKSESTAIHAWLWLPEGDYGLSGGFHDLTDLSESAAPAIARDINEDGVIVGQSGGIDRQGGRIAVWTIDQGDVTHVQLGAFSAQNTWSGAFAINNQSPPTLVGTSSRSDKCDCAGQLAASDIIRGVRVEFDGSNNTLVELLPSPDAYGEARDVNTPQGTDPLRIAGYTDCAGEQDVEEGEEIEPGVTCKLFDICRPPMDAVLWEPSTRSALSDLGSKGARAMGINDEAQIVGWGYTDESSCQQRALYWASPSATRINLGETMPTDQEEDESRAEAINHLDPPQIVGWNASLGRALLWEYPADTTPDVTDLNSSAAIGGCNSRWFLEEAHDINDDTWIVARGREISQPQDTYAFLLTPFPEYPEDISGDGCVNVTDMLAVISGWGNCPIGVICHADVNGDCVVNVTDLNAVNAVWNQGCPENFSGGDPAPSLEEMIVLVLEAPISSETQSEIIQELLANWN